MLDLYYSLGRFLQPYRLLLWLLVVAAISAFLGVVFFSPAGDDQSLALGSIVLLLWSLSLVVVAQTFAVPAPIVDPRAGWAQRIRARLAYGFRWFMAVSTTGLFVFVILLSFKAMGILVRG